jgi:hypothetical protein
MRKQPHLLLTIFCLFFLVATVTTSGVLLNRPQAPVLAAAAARPDIGEFVAFCPYSHRAPDDPIVHPNMAGMSHSHDFFGNVTTNATSTLASLLAGDTTCDPQTDLSAYWVPTLFAADGSIIPVEQATFYYLVDVANPADLQPYPPGLVILAGNAHATAPPDSSYFKWSCLGAPDSSTTDFVTCPADSRLELLLNFPDCWDGVNLDSTDHQSHMAYSAGGACPASHRVPVPRLQFKLRYATQGEAGMRLASGAAYTAHGDFFNAWEPAALANRLHCLYNLIKCGPEGFPDGEATVEPTTGPTGQPTVGPTVESTLTPTPQQTPTIVPTVPISAPTVVIFAPLVQP